MNRIPRVFFCLLFFFAMILPAAAAADHIRIRTTFGMEPYGRFSTRNWGSDNQTAAWDTTYGFTPGLEAYVIIGDILEAGAGFKYQIDRRIFRSGGGEEEDFGFIPLYAAVRFHVIRVGTVDMHALLRLGYALFTASGEFRDIWIDDSTALISVSGGMFGSAALGVTVGIVDRSGFGLDFSMDAGYAYHGASGKNAAGKSYPLSYQSLIVDFSLDWRF